MTHTSPRIPCRGLSEDTIQPPIYVSPRKFYSPINRKMAPKTNPLGPPPFFPCQGSNGLCVPRELKQAKQNEEKNDSGRYHILQNGLKPLHHHTIVLKSAEILESTTNGREPESSVFNRFFTLKYCVCIFYLKVSSRKPGSNIRFPYINHPCRAVRAQVECRSPAPPRHMKLGDFMSKISNISCWTNST